MTLRIKADSADAGMREGDWVWAGKEYFLPAEDPMYLLYLPSA